MIRREPISRAGDDACPATSFDCGGLLGVRAPLRDTEKSVVRPYWLVDDIEAAVAAAVKAGGVLALPP